MGRGGVRTEYVPYAKTVNITEKRAPTDESVELLKEFEEKALDKLLSAERIEFINLTGMVYFFQNHTMSDEIDYYFIFNLNGNEIRIKQKCYHREYERFKLALKGFPQGNIIEDMYKSLSQAIALSLLTNCQEEHLKNN